MTTLLREVQAADRLGYQEISDFRAAVKRGEVPAPSRKLRSGRRQVDAWSSREIDEFIDNQRRESSDRADLDAAIGGLA